MSERRLSWGKALAPVTGNRWILLLLRILLGGLLITSGASKLHDQEAFRLALQAYGMLPESLGNLYAAVLPWAEVAIGCCLVLGVFLRFASGLTIPLVISFTIANIYAMVHPIGAAADCSCLGSLVRMSHPVSLTTDFAMLAAAVLLLAGRRRAAALSLTAILERLKLVTEKRPRFALVVSVVAMLVVAIVASVPAETALSSLGVDRELKMGNPVLLFVYGGDDDLLRESETLMAVQERYPQAYYFSVTYNEARPEVKQFHLDSLPALLAITGKTGAGEYALSASFEGPLDQSEVTRALDTVLGR